MIPEVFYTTKYLAVDTETTGLSPQHGDRPFAVSMTTFEGEDFYERWAVNPETRQVEYTESLEEIINLLATRAERGLFTVYHNAPFDITQLYYAAFSNSCGRGSSLLRLRKVFDNIIFVHAGNSARDTYALKPLAKQLCNISDDDESDLQRSAVDGRKRGRRLGFLLGESPFADYHLADPELCKTYAIRDTQRTMRIFKMFLPLYLEPQVGPFSKFREIVDMEHALMREVVQMNLRGVRVDQGKINELAYYYQKVIDEETEKMSTLGFGDLNPRSPKQKLEAFAGLGIAPEKRKRKGKDGSTKQTASIDKKALAKLSGEHPLAKSLLTISEAQHQLNSFILPFNREAINGEPGSFVLYPNFNSVGPRTGRMSCSRPNLQNITGESSPLHKTEVALRVRECFIPRHGCAWLLADYEQVEIWIAGYSSKDSVIMSILEAGKSVHDLTCDRVFGHKPDFSTNRPMYRKLAKILTFSILYGSGPKALSELLGVTYEEAQEYYQTFWKTYSGLRRFADTLEKQVKQQGWVKDVFGRVYFLEKRFAYKALNYIIQGTAAGVMKRAFINVAEMLRNEYPTAHPIMVVHDEFVGEFLLEDLSEELVRKIKACMQSNFHTVIGLSRPLPVEVCFVVKNWGEKIKYG